MRAIFLRASGAAVSLAAASCWLTASLSDLPLTGGTDAGSRDAGHEPDAATADASHDASRDARSDATSPQHDAARDAPVRDAGAGDDAKADARGDASTGPDASCTSSTTYVGSVLASGPLAYWRLDETSGPTAADSSGHGNTATYATSGVTYAQPGVGTADKSVILNGTSGEVLVSPDGGSFASLSEFTGTQKAFTLEAWIEPTTLGAPYRGILSNESQGDAGREGYALYVQQDAGLGFDRYSETTSTPLTKTGVVAVGGWYHVVAVYDPNGTTGGTMSLYVNGTSVASTSTTLSIMGGCAFAIGATHCGTASYFAGNLEDVAVYDYALPVACIQAHYNLGKAP